MSVDSVSSGNGSPVDQVVAQYEAIQRRPIDELEFKKTELNDKNTTYDEIKAKAKELKDLVVKYKRTGGLSEFGSKTTSSSNDKIVTVEGNAKALDGTHTVEVTQLAKNDTLISNQLTKTDTTISASEGVGTKTFDVTVGSETFNLSVELDGTETNATLLEKVTNAINGTIDVTLNAAIVNDSTTTQRLTLSSKETGFDNRISIVDTSGTLTASLGLDDSVLFGATTGGYLHADDELNAKLLVDSISIESSSNNVKDVISGVTLNLKSAKIGEEVTIGVKTDVDGLKATVEGFLEKFNGLLDYINGASFVDKATFLRGPLSGETAYQGLRFKLRSFIVEEVKGLNSDQPTTLAAIGATIKRDGTISITDSELFKEKAEEDPKFISDLFNSENGLAKRFDDYLLNFTQTGGIIDQSKNTTDEKIKNVTDRVTRYEARLEVQLETYRRQFAQLQELMSGLQSQQSVLDLVYSGNLGGGRF